MADDEAVRVHQAYVTGAHFIYIARCNCGWGSPTHWNWADAYADKAAHLARVDGTYRTPLFTAQADQSGGTADR